MYSFGAVTFDLGAVEILILVLLVVVVASIAWGVARAVTGKKDDE